MQHAIIIITPPVGIPVTLFSELRSRAQQQNKKPPVSLCIFYEDRATSHLKLKAGRARNLEQKYSKTVRRGDCSFSPHNSAFLLALILACVPVFPHLSLFRSLTLFIITTSGISLDLYFYGSTLLSLCLHSCSCLFCVPV